MIFKSDPQNVPVTCPPEMSQSTPYTRILHREEKPAEAIADPQVMSMLTCHQIIDRASIAARPLTTHPRGGRAKHCSHKGVCRWLTMARCCLPNEGGPIKVVPTRSAPVVRTRG